MEGFNINVGPMEDKLILIEFIDVVKELDVPSCDCVGIS